MSKTSPNQNQNQNIKTSDIYPFQNQKKYDFVVGIGASAGGLEALQQFLTALPSNTGFPYIIIQHLSPDYKSLLSEILSKYTEMPVIQAEDRMEVHANKVYVIQPGKNMIIENGILRLSSQKERELNLPIDMFFRSLAEYAGPHAISIILSGTGSDGSNGIKSIKENDGMILVQDVESAKFDGMPRSAIRTGFVDAQISPENIAHELVHISTSISADSLQRKKNDRLIDEDLIKKIYAILKKVSNVNFTHYKRTTIIRRIERRMMLTHKESLEDYVDYLVENVDEVKTLSKEVLIGVTNFFRDPEYFQVLKDKVIHNILLKGTKDEPIRVWVAGCSTGEEAYSIAILFCEEMEALKIKRSIKIFATDLNVESIAFAGKGTYNDNIIDSVSSTRLSRYFTRQNNAYIVNRDIRKMIIFSPHHVFQDPPFGRIDLISCRNMLIYFQPILQNDLFNVFHSSLKDRGYLFLGKSETIGAYTEAFPVFDAVAKIYTHKSDVKISGTKSVPFLQSTFADDDISYQDYENRIEGRNMSRSTTSNENDTIDIQLLEQFMPACLVINKKNEIVHVFGESGNFVHLSIGKFTNNLFDILTEALKVPVSTVLKDSREKKDSVQYKEISFVGEKEKATITLTATPVGKVTDKNDQLYAVIFSEENQRTGKDVNAVTFDVDRIAAQRITDLTQDLNEVQGKLDKSIAEQECVNEELQAANEELLTANEELQSSNEELQSVNEELYTVNSEYQQKLSELADLNDDIANFLSSTLIGIIFVDNKLCIRRYTDYVTSEFSVMNHDIGRSLKFISYHFPSVDISEICDHVLKTLVPDEREVSTSKRKVFFMRVAPYRSTENKILGCVITLVDVTTQKQGLVKLQSTEEKLSLIKQASDAQNDFLSRISHEIRTPMGVLTGLSKMAKAQIDNKDALLTNLDKISNTVQYMASLVTDISEASKTEMTNSNISEPFLLRTILRNINTIIEKQADEKKITFEISIDDDFDPCYVGNMTALSQILVNFISNAIKYTQQGGDVSVKVFERDCIDNSSTLVFIISDTGRGIAKEFIPEMFKPFTREIPDDENEHQSIGLGLSIAYNLIKSMNGDVTVESEADKGSTFTISLKMFKKSSFSNTNALKQVTKDELLHGVNVLIAEDNTMNRMILGSILKSENITFSEAKDGRTAVKMFIEAPANTYDCILMDMRMPNMDGIQATSIIRESGKDDAKTIPIIGVSANGFSEDIQKAMLSGLNDYTCKPIDKEALFDIMRKLIVKKDTSKSKPN